jgi:hypothetical protein
MRSLSTRLGRLEATSAAKARAAKAVATQEAPWELLARAIRPTPEDLEWLVGPGVALPELPPGPTLAELYERMDPADIQRVDAAQRARWEALGTEHEARVMADLDIMAREILARHAGPPEQACSTEELRAAMEERARA